ncbi:carbohydrate ABC transporter permease [Deinococcus roseus]|uniref:Sugar ABC transporter permease n=1 Tax=Deinococcus roseus TaxID=392414 RepID=A0ABQ2DH09_9DEIO|nr:carbohydrate ABC transporter permease [Deinococcus roseus]GGJ57400.1 sugar ABC transporter permease [Deinococcus roseus]
MIGLEKASRRTALAGRKKHVAGTVMAFIVASLITLSFAVPLYWMIVTSLKGDSEVFLNPPTLYPHTLVWENFSKALNNIPFFDYLKNTLYYAVFSSIGSCLSSSLVAYGFCKIRWVGREWVFNVLLATMLLPSAVTMIPTYLIFRDLGWTGTLLPLIVPSFFGSAYYIFLMRQFIQTMPDELAEAARIDGGSEFVIFVRIIFPLIRPVLAVVFLQQFLMAFKDFMGPLIYLSDPSQYTLSLGLQQFQGANGQEWGPLMACATIFTLPLFVLFFFTQRYFVEGVTFTGIKG